MGLLVGLALMGWRYLQLNQRLRRMLRELRADAHEVPLSMASQLAVSLDLQRQTLQQLEQQLKMTRHTLYIAPIGYLQVDEENRLIFANPPACRLLDLQLPNTARPRLLLELVRSYELDCLIEQTRREQVLCEREWSFHRVSADPTQISHQPPAPLRGHGIPLSKGHVGIFIEDRQEAALLMQQRDRWASDVAHELKTPLTSIRLVAETLRSRVDPALTSWIDRLLNETIRLSNLVQDLLDLSRMEQGTGYQLNLTKVNLPDLIQRAWLSLEPLATAKQLQLDYLGPQRLLLALDEPRLFRVLLNLLDNAIQYSPPRSMIQVQLGLVESGRLPGSDRVNLDPEPSRGQAIPDQQVQIDVIDAGAGFRPEDLPYVFDRFYRSDTARSRQPAQRDTSSLMTQSGSSATQPYTHIGGGSGLGLAIVHQIVLTHQGTVTAQNHPETGGGWLQIRLPYPIDSPPTSR